MSDYKVSTFNLKNDMPLTRKFLKWITRRDAVVKCIEKINADILGVQELTDEMLDTVSTLKKTYSKVGLPRNKNPKSNSERTDIFYKTSRFTCIASKTFWLSNNPDKPGSKLFLSPFPRICTYAMLQDKQTGEIVNVYNTHLDHLFSYTRSKEAEILIKQLHLLGATKNVILLGDLNTNSDSNTVKKILSNEIIPLRSTYANTPSTNTMHYGNGKLKNNALPIDYIFVGPEFHVRSTRIIIDEFEGMYPSDHYPVVTMLTLKSDDKI